MGNNFRRISPKRARVLRKRNENVFWDAEEDSFVWEMHCNKCKEVPNKKVSSGVGKVMDSGAPVEKWDHYQENSQGGSIFSYVITTAKIKGTNPLFEIDGILNQKSSNILALLCSNQSILVNMVGGYYDLTEEHDILYCEDYTNKKPKPNTYVINDNTKYINLENDSKLEDHVKDILPSVDQTTHMY